MYLTYKVKIYPDKVAINKLWQVSYICKDLWNIFNEQRYNSKTNYYKQKKELPKLKKENELFKIPSSQVLQEVTKSLDKSWKSYFSHRKQGNKKAKPPKYKSYKYFFTQKYPQANVSFIIENNKLKLAYGKNKKTWIEIKIPELSDIDRIKTVTIFYDKVSKNWYASIVKEVELSVLKDNPHQIYFDPGCKTALTGIKTNYNIYEYDLNPLKELCFKYYQLIDKLTSMRDKKQKSSRRYRYLNTKIHKLYVKIRGIKHHYLHKLTNTILDNNPDVSSFNIGNWKKRETLANTGYKFVNKRINRQVQNNNPLGKLIEYLSYKSLLRGQKVEKFNESGSTRTCSRCGYVYKTGINPQIRTFKCPNCGFECERDINSVLNNLKSYQYATWLGLRDIEFLSIVRYQLKPQSGENRNTLNRVCVLNYQDACSL
jgi:putative transposase